jgi:putative transposase
MAEGHIAMDKSLANSNESLGSRSAERWAQLRFSVVGPLLAAPPGPGQLRLELKHLAERKWRHPITGAWTSFGRSTIERWY